MIDETRYLKERVEDQEQWYDRKSSYNQRWYKYLAILQIVAAAIIPFLSGNPDAFAYIPWVIGSLGVIIAIASAASSLYKFQENWIQYRTTCETLRHQKYLYLTKTSPYDGPDAFHLFVRNIEALISKENSTWSQYVMEQEQDTSGAG